MARPRPKYRLHIRRFLNRKGFHSSAHIIAKVENTEAKGVSADWIYPDIELTIADCSRSISLDFDLMDGAERQNSMWKLDKLIADLEQFRLQLRAEARLAAARERARAAKDAEDKKKGITDGTRTGRRVLRT